MTHVTNEEALAYHEGGKIEIKVKTHARRLETYLWRTRQALRYLVKRSRPTTS